jgi:hypothetical protein
MQEGAWYRLVVALVTALAVFSNQFFGTHISTADALSVASAGIALILAEAAILHGKGGKVDPSDWSSFLLKVSGLIKEISSPTTATKTATGTPPATASTTINPPVVTVAPPAAAGTAADSNTGDKLAHDA